MSAVEHTQDVSLNLPEHTVSQLNELVRSGRFKNRQTAVAAAIERLYAKEHRHRDTRREALGRVCGALQLGTTRESLRKAEYERLDWETSTKVDDGSPSQ